MAVSSLSKLHDDLKNLVEHGYGNHLVRPEVIEAFNASLEITKAAKPNHKVLGAIPSLSESISVADLFLLSGQLIGALSEGAKGVY